MALLFVRLWQREADSGADRAAFQIVILDGGQHSLELGSSLRCRCLRLQPPGLPLQEWKMR
jgi:hypothetical protein